MLYSVVATSILGTYGIDTKPLITGIGISGFVVGFALKEIATKYVPPLIRLDASSVMTDCAKYQIESAHFFKLKKTPSISSYSPHTHSTLSGILLVVQRPFKTGWKIKVI
jgi:hypothetical protein